MTKTFAQYNVLTITGRISHAELVNGEYGEFLAVTVLSELTNDAAPVAVQFNMKDGLLFAMTKKGYDVTGRYLTVTGHLKGFTELYFDKKLGKTKRLQRPRLELEQVSILPGALGAGKKQENQVIEDDLDIDEAPELPKAAPAATTPSGKPVDF